MISSTTLAVSVAMELLADAVESAEPGEVWLSGEVAGVTRSRNGHLYFSLHPPGDTTVSLGIAALRSDAGRLLATLRRAGVELADGQAVRVQGRLSFHPRRGQVQFLATEIDPRVANGKTVLGVEALRETLTVEGEIDRQRALRIADVPLRVLVAGPAGQGTDDVCAVLARSPYAFKVTTAFSSVETVRGPQLLAEAIARGVDYDVVVVARGGGSMIRGAFDSECVCRSICVSPVPVIVAVGHTSDRTLADECAWRSVATPTAAGELLVDILGAAERRLDVAIEGVERSAQDLLVAAGSRVDAMVAGIESVAFQSGRLFEARSAASAAGAQVWLWRMLAVVEACALIVLLVVLFTLVR